MHNSYVIDNTDLREKKFAILQEISNAIAYTNNLGYLTNLMLDLSVSYTSAERGSLMLINDRGELYIHASRGLDKKFASIYREKIGEGIAGTIVKNRTPVLVEDIDEYPEFKGKTTDNYKTKSFISCPIILKNRALGVININDKKDHSPFTEDEFSLLKVIANQAALILENALLVTRLKSKAEELEEINKKLIESDVVKTEFLTRISHELRTPLNSIKGSTYYLLQSGKLSKSEQREFFTIISQEANKLIHIVENLLDFLRIEDESRVLKKSLISLPDLLDEVLNSNALKTLFEKKGIQIATSVKDSGISDIIGDRIRVMQLFINLLEGLSRNLEQKDSIKISVRENDYVSVTIITSRRLPDSLIPFIYDSESIFQHDKNAEKLKLYLARKTIDVHGWSIHAKNNADAFAVTITIPKNARQKIEAVMNSFLGIFTDFISEMLGVNTCSIMLNDDLTGELTIRYAKGLDDDIVKRTRIRYGDRISGWVALEGKPLFINNIDTESSFKASNSTHYTTKSLISLPLKIDGKVIGVVNLNNKKNDTSFTVEDLYIATVLSERIAQFFEKLHTCDYHEEDIKQCRASFENLLCAEKKYHKKLSLFPATVLQIMDHLGASEEDKKIAAYVSIIYDLGLMLIDDQLLKKKKLVPSELRTVQVHPYFTVSLLNNFEFSEQVKLAVLHHHERYDGTGYPDGLKGEEIPFISRVIAVVDAFCAMTSERPYRKIITKEDAIGEIVSGAGSLYDPGVVAAFQTICRKI